ncbi:MAG TPA: hypothetical protein VMS86_12480 [Thermoanaerobaculia bacterium]|nr:hypothetical protein [Thermoanaerobaculia bacterium]
MTHALRVEEGSEAFRSLLVAVREQGERVGWLELDAAARPDAAASAAAGAIGRILEDGAWKAVVVEEGRSVAVKIRRGPPVLRDLLREHFRGCRVVLVRGDLALPTLRRRGADWDLEGLDGEVRRLGTMDLVRALRAPRLPL